MQAPALSTLQLILVARHMTSSVDLRHLAAHLGVEDHLVESEIQRAKSTPDAACNVLYSWRRTVATREEAYRLLRAAVMACGHRQVVAEILDS